MIRQSSHKKQFLKLAEGIISIDPPWISDEAKITMKREIAKSLYSVARYSSKMGLHIELHDLPEIRINDDDPFYKGDCVAFYSNRTIYIKNAYWPNRRVLAHEFFHFHQDRYGILNEYRSHPEQSFTEGGAEFFSMSYVARHHHGAKRIGEITSGLRTEINFVALYSQFRQLEESDRIRFLNTALGLGKYIGDSQEKYRDGAKFAFMSYALNGFRTKRTIKGFLEHNKDGLVANLASQQSSLSGRVNDFIGLLRRYPGLHDG